MASRPAVALMAVLPVPMGLVRLFMLRDNVKENHDSWGRLRADTESARYAAVRAATERYAGDGFVLDVGCSQGILVEGLCYGRYLGVDASPPAIALASAKTDDRTTFVVADATTYVADAPPRAVVLNEMVYYLRRPADAVEHYAAQLGPDGVVVLSVFAHSWSSRRLLRTLARRLRLVESTLVSTGHLGWTVAVYRPLTV